MYIRNPLPSSMVTMTVFWFMVTTIVWFVVGTESIVNAIDHATQLGAIILAFVAIGLCIPFAMVAFSRRAQRNRLSEQQGGLQRSTIGRVPLTRIIPPVSKAEINHCTAQLKKAVDLPGSELKLPATILAMIVDKRGNYAKKFIVTPKGEKKTLQEMVFVLAQALSGQAQGRDLSAKAIITLSVAYFLCFLDKPAGNYGINDIDPYCSAKILSHIPVYHALPYGEQRLLNLSLSYVGRAGEIPAHAPKGTYDYVMLLEQNVL